MTAGYLTAAGTYDDFGEALRHATFNVVTIATDCGYDAASNCAAWPCVRPDVDARLSCITVSSGSTGEGIKMIRILVIARQAANQIKQLIHPRAVLPLLIGGRSMPDSLRPSTIWARD